MWPLTALHRPVLAARVQGGIVMVMLALALAGCSSFRAAANPTPTAASPAGSPTRGLPPVTLPFTLPSGTPVTEQGNDPRPSAIVEIVIQGQTFSPNPTTIPVLGIGLWSNNSEEEHSIVGPGWELGPMAPGQAWAHTFKASEVGTVTYYSKTHPEITGRITVTPAP